MIIIVLSSLLGLEIRHNKSLIETNNKLIELVKEFVIENPNK